LLIIAYPVFAMQTHPVTFKSHLQKPTAKRMREGSCIQKIYL